jgi:hypothetical protein
MASASFRDSMNSLGWSRREPEPVNTSSPSLMGRLQSLNPFGDGGYVRLPITETNPGAPLPAPTRREEEEGWFACKYQSCFVAKHLHSPWRVLSVRVLNCPHTPGPIDAADLDLLSALYTLDCYCGSRRGLVIAAGVFSTRLVSLAFPHRVSHNALLPNRIFP